MLPFTVEERSGFVVAVDKTGGGVKPLDYYGKALWGALQEACRTRPSCRGTLSPKDLLDVMENSITENDTAGWFGRISPDGYSTVDARMNLSKVAFDLNGMLITKDTSDGYHTFRELYLYRMLYNAHAAHGWLASGISVVKSRRHHDGEECFGGGMFIVVAQLPTGQVSNHYKDEFWDLFQVPDEPTAPEWDGHTPAVAAARLKQMLIEDDTTDYDEWLMG